jgi:hypothetical protein
VILPLLLAATASAALTFEGVALGGDAAKVAAAHDAFSTVTALGMAWSWHRDGGGTILIAGDANGKIQAVDFSAAPGESDTVDLPGAGAFDVRQPHDALERALGAPAATCGANYSGGYCGEFALSGGTVLLVQFEGPGDGPLRRATWASPGILTKLHMLPAA